MADWRDADNADAYDRFAQAYPTFRETSVDLVALAGLGNASTVVDLACGTGVTTETILAQVGEAARVVAIDVSEAMLTIARRRVPDRRVEWICARATQMSGSAGEVDTIICNSAMWQLDVEATLRAAARGLRKGGTLAFNIPHPVMSMPVADDDLPAASGRSLHELIMEIATREYRFVPQYVRQSDAPPFRPLTYEGVDELLHATGFGLAQTRLFAYENTANALLAWLKVPVFADNVLPGMPHEDRVRVMDAAFERCAKEHVPPSKWVAFRATKL